MTSLAFAFFTPQMWSHVPIEDPRAAKIFDGHYSRQSPGEDGLVAPGKRFLLMHEGSAGSAIWAVVRNRWKAPGWAKGVWYWRNSIFRNVSSTRSSDLIKGAVDVTYELWGRRYGLPLPAEGLTTEIDIEATREHRSPWHEPGWCYKKAGWTHVRDTPREHGRSAKSIWKAPPP